MIMSGFLIKDVDKFEDKKNIECDVIGKYVERFTSKKSSGITLEFLKENGF